MKVNIERPTQTTFEKLRCGRVFELNGDLYIKGKDLTCTVIYKTYGHMNAGELQSMPADTVVQYVTEVTFKLGCP